MLDIVQSFPLLSYCIVSPIYISPICNVEINYSEKIKLGILYFSLFTGYSVKTPACCNRTHGLGPSSNSSFNT